MTVFKSLIHIGLIEFGLLWLSFGAMQIACKPWAGLGGEKFKFVLGRFGLPGRLKAEEVLQFISRRAGRALPHNAYTPLMAALDKTFSLQAQRNVMDRRFS